MKFWQVKQESPLETKFILNTLPGGHHGPGETIEDGRLAERELTMAECQSCLKEFIDNAEAIKNLSTTDQVRLLSVLSNTEKDSESDDRGLWERMRDTVGSGLEYVLPEGATQYLQSAFDGTTVNSLIPHISSAAKVTFLNNFKAESRKLCTDQTGENSFRATMYGDSVLESTANLGDMFADYPDNRFVIMGSEHYVRTARGYVGFHPEGIKGNIARIESGTTFEMASNLPEESPQAKTLANLTATDTLFSGLDTPAEVRKLERWRSQNFSLSQTWKGFAKDMKSKLSDFPVFQGFNERFSDNFIRFLDGNFYVNAVVDGNEGLSFEGIPPLDSSEDPSQFQAKVEQALEKMTGEIRGSITKLQDQLKDPNITADEKKEVAEQLSTVTASASEVLQIAGVRLAELEAEANEWLAISNDHFMRTLEGKIDRAQLNTFLANYDAKLLDLLKTEPFDSEAQYHITVELLASILGSTTEARTLAETPEIKGLMRERLDIIEKRIRLNDLNYKLQTRAAQLQTLTDSPNEQVGQVLRSLGIDMSDYESVSVEKLKEARGVIAARLTEIRSLPEGERSHDSPASYEVALRFIDERIASLETVEAKSADSETLVAGLDRGAETAHDNLEKWMDPETPEGAVFHDTVDITSDYVREYREAHDGEVPEITPDLVRDIRERIEAGESKEEIKRSLNLNIKGDTPNLVSQNYSEQFDIVGVDPDHPHLRIVNLGSADEGEYRLDPNRGLIHKNGLDTPFAESLFIDATNPAGAMAMGGLIKSQYLNGSDGLAFETRAFGNMEMNELFSVLFAKRNGEALPATEAQAWETFGVALNRSGTSFGQIIDALADGNTHNRLTNERTVNTQDMAKIESGLSDILKKAQSMTADQLATHITAISSNLLS